MTWEKVDFREALERTVIENDKCLGCGACVLACPYTCLRLEEQIPKLIKECPSCGICNAVCPQASRSISDVETFVFGKKRTDKDRFGLYRRLAITQATDPALVKACQDGGAVTSLLMLAKERGFIDGAIVCGTHQDKPFFPIPTFAETKERIMACAKTKYFFSPNLLALREVIKGGHKNIAFVGTPCQIQAIRAMQMAGLKKLVAPVKYLVGLMCSVCFNYEGLMVQYLQNKVNVPLRTIQKMNIKGDLRLYTNLGVQSIPLSEIRPYTRKSCASCGDFSAELADISAGGLGLTDWTFLISRTESGDRLLLEAEKAGVLKLKDVNQETFKKGGNPLKLLCRLSTKKRC